MTYQLDMPPDTPRPCQGKDYIFFPAVSWGSKGELKGPEANEARAICATCPFQTPCLAHALEYEEHGIWGGLDPAQRRKLRGGTRGKDFRWPWLTEATTPLEETA